MQFLLHIDFFVNEMSLKCSPPYNLYINALLNKALSGKKLRKDQINLESINISYNIN